MTVNPFSKQQSFFIQHQNRHTGIKKCGKISFNFIQMWRGKYVFLSECSSTSKQFTEPIRKTSITTFASENFERKIQKN